MKKIVLIILLIPFLYGCPYPCNGTQEDLGPLSDAALGLCPYQHEGKYKFVHNNGQVIEYNTSRIISKDEFYGFSDCGSSLKFEKCEVKLSPDYPIFKIDIVTHNIEPQMYEFIISIGFDYFKFLYSDLNGFLENNISDSLIINAKTYYNVLKLANLDEFSSRNQLCDSVFYNVEKGILRIKLKNGENYTRYE